MCSLCILKSIFITFTNTLQLIYLSLLILISVIILIHIHFFVIIFNAKQPIEPFNINYLFNTNHAHNSCDQTTQSVAPPNARPQICSLRIPRVSCLHLEREHLHQLLCPNVFQVLLWINLNS